MIIGKSALLVIAAALALAMAPTREAAAQTAVFNRLGCGSCHGAPGAGRGSAGDLVQSLPRMPDAETTLYDFMRDAQRGHPDLTRPREGKVIAQVTQPQARELVAELRAAWDRTRGEKGRAEGAAVAAAAGAPCKVVDGAYIPLRTEKRSKTQVDAFELACEGGLGRVVVRTTTAGKAAYELRDCLQASEPLSDGKPNPLACSLPANRDPAAQIAPLLKAAGAACDLRQVRSLGSSVDSTYVEAACAQDRGYLLTLPMRAGPVTARSCLALAPGGAVECKLTPREAMLASVTDPLIGSAGAACQVKARRFVLSNRGDDYYEVACTSGAGFMVVADATGAYKSNLPCDAAEGVDGGCTLTDLKAVQTADNATYAAALRRAGYDCAVSGYRLVAVTAAEATVEVACANHPDGAVARLPKAGPAQVFNCAAAETTGYVCRLTKADAAYGRLTAAVKAAHPTSACQVAASRFLGVSPDGGYVEVACADGAPGYVLQYAKASGAATAAIYCTQLRPELGVTCGLPGNARR